MVARVLQERHGEVMGGPLCEQHCALGQQGQWDELCCGLVGGMVHGQTAGPHPGGLHGLQDVLVDEPRDELRERSRGLAEQLSGLGEQMGGLGELMDEQHEQLSGLFDEQSGDSGAEWGGLVLGGFPLELFAGGHCGGVRLGEGQGRAA